MLRGVRLTVPCLWVGLALLLPNCSPSGISIEETTYRGVPHFVVNTETATYFIERSSGGCSSLIDPDGRDWVAFRQTGNDNPTNSADSDYRGIPNLVFREPGDGVGHPGFDVCSTEQVSDRALVVRSNDSLWQFRWIFHPTYAEVVVEKTDTARAYWFLYEGPVAGDFSPDSHYWGNDVGGLRSDQPSIFGDPASGDWRWAFFGDIRIEQTLFLAQAAPDPSPDFFAYMGNEAERGNLSDDGMNVFGFGRGRQTNPELRGPNRFVLGFWPGKVDGPASLDALRHFIEERL